MKKDTDLEFKITDRGLLISPKQSREGWTKAFEARKKQQFLMGTCIENEFEKDEWEW